MRDKRRAWFMDQYRNPHESLHTMDETLEWFDEAGIRFVRGLPSTVLGSRFSLDYRSSVLDEEPRGSRLDRLFSQLQQLLQDTEGGLFAVVDRTVIMPESGGSMTDLPVFQELLTEMGFPLRTVTMTREMLRHASEVFVVDSALSVLDVIAIDGRTATAGRHVAKALRRALDRVFESDDLRSRLWLEHVGTREPLPWPKPSNIDVFDLGYGHGV